jgi:tetratricopeptide (TPR) repeat protein
MRIILLAPLVVGLLAAPRAVLAQPYAAPTRTPSASTAAEDRAISGGVTLHDQGKFDEAIARYQDVLKENPDNITAMFELAFSYSAKGDHQKALDTAGKGAEYKSDLLARFYDVIGGSLDSMGEPQKAIAAYARGAELVPDDGLLYFNMAVTYHESLKDPIGARTALKKSISIEPDNEEAHRLLGQLYQSGGYKTQAALALARFLTMADPNSRDALQAYGLWRAVLRGNNDPALPKVPDGPKLDEGDFTAIDALIDTTQATAMKAMDDGESEMQALVGQLTSVMARIANRNPASDRGTFVGRFYVPYFAEMWELNFIEPFAYWISQRAPVPGVTEWINAHETQVRAFINWSNKRLWPAQ